MVPLRAMQTDECVCGGTDIIILDFMYMEVIGQLYIPAALPPRETPPTTR